MTCCARALAAFGPAIEAVVVYNSNPIAVAPDSSKVVAGFAREDLFTVVLEHFQTDTADYADFVLAGHDSAGTLGRAHVIRSHRRAAESSGDCSAGRSSTQHRSVPGTGAPDGIQRTVLRRRRPDAVPHGIWRSRRLSASAGPGVRLAGTARGAVRAKAAFRRRRASASSSASGWRGRDSMACPITFRTTRRPMRPRAIHWP